MWINLAIPVFMEENKEVKLYDKFRRDDCSINNLINLADK